ncbi:MAG: TolC family outer membrane protein [Planktomarina sp.]
MRYHLGIKAFFIGASLTLTPLGAAAETLKDALRSAYANSGLLEQNRALLRAADEDVAQAAASLRPVINWVAQVQSQRLTEPGITTDTSSITLSAEWLLYDFGRTDLRVESLKETVLATRAQLVGIEQNVLLQAASAYLNYSRAVDAEALRQSNVKLIAEQLRAAEDRFDVGEVTRTDVETAKARLAAANAQLAQAAGDRVRAAAEFQRAVGHKPGTLSTPAGLPRLPSSVNAALSAARKNHPDMIATKHQVTASELVVQQAELARRPQLKLSLSATENNTDGTGLIGSIGATASGQLYGGGAISSQQRQAVARRDAARSGLLVTGQIVDQNVRNAYVLLEVARASAAASDRQIRAASVAFRGVQEEATLGARTTLDVLNAEQELLDARTSRLSAGMDEQIAAYTILAATGQMTAKALNLGVKTYDPTEYYNMVNGGASERGNALDRVLRSIGGK